jgi:hypothetical protein
MAMKRKPESTAAPVFAVKVLSVMSDAVTAETLQTVAPPPTPRPAT